MITQNGRHFTYQKNVLMVLMVNFDARKPTMENVNIMYTNIDYMFRFPSNKFGLFIESIN